MEYIQFTEFRNNSRYYFDNVEEGKSYIVVRKGKPVAKIQPFDGTKPSWKRRIKRIKLREDAQAIDYILQERAED